MKSSPDDRRVLDDNLQGTAHFDDLAESYDRAFGEFVAPLRTRMIGDAPTRTHVEMVRSGPLALTHTDSGNFLSSSDREGTDRTRAGLILCAVAEGDYEVEQDGRRSRMTAGGVALFHTQAPLQVFAPMRQVSRLAVLPEPMVVPLVGDIGRLAGRQLGSEAADAALLVGYMASMDLSTLSDRPALGTMVARHLSELLAAILANADGREDPAGARGVKAARLSEVRRLVEENLGNPMLSAERIGRRLGLSARYVQKLMEESGTTFSAYLLERRLTCAFDRLSALPVEGPTVAAVASDVGFSDPSHFSRAFRRRFGETPGAIRGCGIGNAVPMAACDPALSLPGLTGGELH